MENTVNSAFFFYFGSNCGIIGAAGIHFILYTIDKWLCCAVQFVCRGQSVKFISTTAEAPMMLSLHTHTHHTKKRLSMHNIVADDLTHLLGMADEKCLLRAKFDANDAEHDRNT